MPLDTIYVTRHGFRSSWSVDPVTGIYSSSIRSPTGIVADPALTSHGVAQAKELASHLMTLDPPIEAVYSSPFYRCLQTIDPFVQLCRQSYSQPAKASPASSVSIEPGRPTQPARGAATIRPEHGLREWFGAAPFEHPQPASAAVLKSLFPAYDESYTSALAPSSKGETLEQLQDRIATALRVIIQRCDADGTRAIVLCSHAAVVILLGRILTGEVPDSVETDDFHAFTCGLSVYQRRGAVSAPGKRADQDPTPTPLPGSTNSSVIGNWDCLLNSDCSFLSGGEERGWSFVGDESFPNTGSMSQNEGESKL